MAEGAVDEAVDLWLHIADRHPEPAAQADCYRRVLSLCPGEPRALEALAELHEQAGDWEQTVSLLSTLADATSSSARRAELEHRVGCIKWQHLGDDQRAEVHFLHALAMRGSHMPSVSALVQIYRARNDWEGAAEVLLRAEARTGSLSLRLELLLEAACIHRDHLRSSRAAELLEALLAIDPGHLPAVEVLADIYCREPDWERAKPLLEQLEDNGASWPESAIEQGTRPEPARVAVDDPRPADGWLLDEDPNTLEIVLALEEDQLDRDQPEEEPLDQDQTNPALEIGFADPDQVDDPRSADGWLLDEDPEELEIVLAQEEDQQEQDQQEQEQQEQERLEQERLEQERLEQDRLEQDQLEQDQLEQDQLQQELLEEDQTSPGLEIGFADPGEVMARVRAKLQEDPRDAQSYRTLRALFTHQGHYDKAWCVCATMTYLGCASPRERLYYETYKPPRVAQRGETLTREMWDRIFHPDQDPRVAVIARAIGRELALMHAQPIRHHGLSAKDRRDTSNDQLALTRALERAAEWLRVPLPDLYLAPDQPGGLSLENVAHRGRLSPSLVARGNALRGRTPGELDCIAGRTLALMQPDFFLMVVLPNELELRATWQAALALARPLVEAGHSAAAVEGTRARLERALSARARAELALAVNGSGLCFGSLDIAAWRRAVELTAQRIGLILCGDPAVAARTLLEEAAPAGAAKRTVESDQLLLYAVSEEYFAVRRQLNGTIDAQRSAGEVRPAA